MILPLAGALSPLGRAGKVPSSLLTGLVSYWKLDEASGARADSAGPNNLTSNNGVGQTTGKLGNAAAFAAASNTYLSISNASQSGLGFTGSFTLSCWFNPTSLASGSCGLISKGASVGSEGGYGLIMIDSANDIVRFVVSDGTNNRVAQFTFSGSVSFSAWHHVLAWYDAAANSLNVQVDGGSVVTTTPTGSAPITNAVEFRVGRYSTINNDWDGGIDDVACWSRTLTSAERSALYNGGAGLAYPFS